MASCLSGRISPALAAESSITLNLIPNSSFETDAIGHNGAPSRWQWSGPKELATVSSDKPFSNFGNSLHLDFRDANRSDNIWYCFSEYLPIDSKSSYLQSGWIKTSGSYEGFGASIVRRFYDVDKKLISKPIDQKFLARNADPMQWGYYSQAIVPQRYPESAEYADDEIPTNARYMQVGLLAMYYPREVWFSDLRLEPYSPAIAPLSYGDNKIVSAIDLPPGQSIEIDGKMDDVWKTERAWQGDFTRTVVPEESISRIEQNQQTRFKVAQNQENIYLFVQSYSPDPSALKVTTTKHNDVAVFNDDCIEIFLDATGERRMPFHLGVNSAGAYYEEWAAHAVNLGLNVATQKNSDSWQVEIAIPREKLWQIYNEAGSDIDDGLWNINVARHAPNAGDSRYSSWAYTGLSFHSNATLGFLLLKDASKVLLTQIMSDNQQLHQITSQRPKDNDAKALDDLKSTFSSIVDYSDAAERVAASSSQLSVADFAYALRTSRHSIGAAKDTLEKMQRLMVDLPEDRKSFGYALFQTPLFERPNEKRIPVSDELISKISFQGARNEPMQYSFSLFSKTDLNDVEITWGDLRDEQGNIIPQDALDIRILEPWGDLQQADILATDLRVKLQGWLTDYSQKQRFIPAIAQDTSRKMWINFDAKSRFAAGTYNGTVTIRPSNKPATTAPIEITILPFELPETNKRVGFFFHGVLASENQPPLGQPSYMFYNGLTTPDEYLRELKAMRQAGFTMISLVDYAKGPLDVDYTRQILTIAKEAGFESIALVGGDHIVPSSALSDPQKLAAAKEKLRERLTKVYEIVTELDISDLYIFGADEPHTEDGYERNRVIADIVHELGGKTTVAMIFLSAYDAINEIIDLPIMSWARAAANPKAIERYQAAQKSGKDIMYYGNLVADQTLLSRYTYGKYLYKSRFNGNLVWAYYYLGLNWEPFPEKGFSPTAYYAIPTKDDPIPTLKFESAKAGVTDLRYYEFIEELLVAAGSDTHSETIRKKVDETLSDVPVINAKGTDSLKDSLNAKDFDKDRGVLQQLVIELMQK